MRPHLRWRMPPMTACVTRNIDLTLMLQHHIPLGFGDVFEFAGDGDAGVVDEDIDGTEFTLDIADHAAHFGGEGYVGLHGQCVPSQGVDVRTDLLRCVGAFPVVDCDTGACAGKCEGDARADATAGPGDESDAILQVMHGGIVVRASLGQRPMVRPGLVDLTWVVR